MEDVAENRYEVREVIGKGAFGDVYLVVEKGTKAKYVLKRIKMARQSEWQRRATRQEIEIASRLRHPFIMPYKEHWTHHGHTICVVYGYCEKGDLSSAVQKQRGKPFSEETLRLWLAELLLASEYMHRQNVLHRDIKTQNILLTAEGDVAIGDFGLSTVRVPSASEAAVAFQEDPDTQAAKDSNGSPGAGAAATPEHHRHGAPHHTVHTVHADHDVHGPDRNIGADPQHLMQQLQPVDGTKPGTRNDYAVVGTPHFMSPELLSSQKYSFETDIWSLGVVMYELTTLKPPFNAFNLAGLAAKIKRAALPPIPASYSAEWSAVLKSMLRKDPGRRARALDLLGTPCMQAAVAAAIHRAIAMCPDYRPPDIPVSTLANADSFSFNAAAANDAAVHRTPSLAAAVAAAATPTLALPAAGEGASDAEVSPLSKFPNLDAPSPRAAQQVAAAAPAPAVEVSRVRHPTPGATRKASGPVPPLPNATAAAKRAPTPTGRGQAPLPTPRGRAPGSRGSGAAPAAAAPDDPTVRAAPSPHLQRKPSLPREGRRVSNTGACEGHATAPTGRPPSRPRADAAAAAPPRAPVAATARVKRGLLDGAAVSAAVPPMRVPAVAVPTPSDTDGEGEIVTGAPEATASAATNASKSSTPTAGGRKSPTALAPAAAPAAAGTSGARTMRETASWRANARASSFTAGRSARPTPAALSAHAVADGPSFTGGIPPAPSAVAAGTKRGAMATESANTNSSAGAAAARGRAAGSPVRTTVSARALPNGTAAVVVKDGDAAMRQPEKRVRRLSYVRTGGLDAPPRKAAAGAAAPVATAAAVGSHPVHASEEAVSSYANSADDSAAPPIQDRAAGAASQEPEEEKLDSFVSAGQRDSEGTASSPPNLQSQAAVQAAADALAIMPGGIMPRCRSMVSMNSEGSDLSMPSDRYAGSETSHGGGGDAELNGNAQEASVSAPPSAGGAAPDVDGGSAHMWTNELYLSTNSALSINPQSGATTPVGRQLSTPPGEQLPLSAGSASLSESLPRRVSISMFSSHIRPEGGANASVGRDDEVSSRSCMNVATPPGLKPSPAESVVTTATTPEHGKVNASGSGGHKGTAGIHGNSGADAPSPASSGPAGRPVLGGEVSFGSPPSAGTQRTFTGFQLHQTPSPSTGLAPGAYGIVPGISPSPSTSSEVTSSPAVQPAPESGLGPAAVASLTGAERSQLVLSQRVLSLAASLYEGGRLAELGTVLSSTLSRPLQPPQVVMEQLPEKCGGKKVPDGPRPTGAAAEVGDEVRVVAGPMRGAEGTVRYRGPCHWGGGVVVGLELPQPSAEAGCEGIKDGVMYFRCKPGHGVFVPHAYIAQLV